VRGERLNARRPLLTYDNVSEARASLPNSSVDTRTPDHASFGHLPQPAAAWNVAGADDALVESSRVGTTIGRSRQVIGLSLTDCVRAKRGHRTTKVGVAVYVLNRVPAFGRPISRPDRMNSEGLGCCGHLYPSNNGHAGARPGRVVLSRHRWVHRNNWIGRYKQ
jgi:hypothetical protein